MTGQKSLGVGVLLSLSACDSVAPPVQPSRTIWRAEGRGWGQPAFDETTVFFVGFDHELIAVRKTDGSIRWRAKTSQSSGQTNGRSALLIGDIVVMGDGGIHAFRRASGEKLWLFDTPDEPGVFNLSTDGQTIFAGSASGRLFAIDATTGTKRWDFVFNSGNAIASNPVVDGGTVYACLMYGSNPTTGGITAVDAAAGKIRWTRDFPVEEPLRQAGCERDVVVAGDLVIGASIDGHLYGVERATGVIRWSTAGSDRVDFRRLAVSGTTVFAGSYNGMLTAYDAVTGRELWSSTASHGSIAYRLVSDASQVYVLHSGGQLAAFDVSTGKVKWHAGVEPTGGEFLYAPVIDTDRLYIGGDHGLYALNK